MRRDWAELGGAPFLFRTEHHVRLVRLDAARWTPDMIVHEALPAADTVRLPVALEHRFADDVEAMRGKVEQYALLWAIRFHRHERRLKPIGLQRFVHVLRETLLKGALFRGGIPAFRLARAVAHHHARKYALLREVRGGAYPELVRAFDEGRFAELFRLLPAAASLRAPALLAHPIHSGALPRSAAVPPSARLAHAPLEIHGSDSR